MSRPEGAVGERIELHVLAPLRVLVDGVEVPIATRRQRALLVLLALNAGRVVPSERLIDQLWDGAPPPQAAVTLRSYVSNVRQALGKHGAGRDHRGGGQGSVLVTRGQGYCLDVPRDCVDATQLAAFAQQGRELLRRGDATEALSAFDAAVRTWTGNPLADVADHAAVQSTITQLTETYLGAAEGRFEALLALGRHADALPELKAFAADHPLREEPVALLMLGLYRAGRAPAALEAHRTLRARLHDELGIDPSPRIDELHQRILQQDDTLAPPVTPSVKASAPALAQAPTQARGTPTDGLSGPGDATHNARAPNRARGGPLVVGRAYEEALLAGFLDSLARSDAVRDGGPGGPGGSSSPRGTGALVLIGGEPGIGKTTLLEGLGWRARDREIAVHVGRSPAAAGAPPFWLWSQVIDAVAAGLDDDQLRHVARGAARPVAQLSTVVADRTGYATPLLGDDSQALRFLLYEAVAAFLRQATAEAPAVVTLDDIHWADPSSLELLSYLTPGLSTQPLLVVAAYRDLPTEASAALTATLATVAREDVAHELTLSGLTAADVADLVAALSDRGSDLGGTVGHADGSFAQLLHRRTAGNPFFVRQLARLLLEQQGSGLRAPGADEGEAADGAALGPDPLAVAAPPGVRHVIAQRLTALPDPARELLPAAAVVGRDFDLRTAAHAAGMDLDDALDAFDEAARHGLVESVPDAVPDRRFVHALVQEVVLEGLPAGRAARLHAAVARHLEHDPSTSAAELARHMWAARDVVGAAAVPSLVAAADAAAAVYALDLAESHLRHALEMVHVTSDSHTQTDREDEATAELSLLLRLFRLVVIGRGWGHPDMGSVLDRAMQLAEAGAYNDDSSRLWWTLFFSLLDRDNKAYVQVADTLRDTIEAPPPRAQAQPEAQTERPQQLGEAARAVVDLFSMFAALHRDDRDLALTHQRAARRHIEAAPPAELAAFEEHLHVMLLLIEGTWAAMHDNRDAYRAASSAAVALADADGRPFPRAVARSLAAACGPYCSDVSVVYDLAGQALDIDEKFRFGWLASIAECSRGWAQAHLSAPTPEIVDRLERQIAEVTAAGRHGNEGILVLMLADVYRLQGRTGDARTAYDRARARPGPYCGLVIDLVDARLRQLDGVGAPSETRAPGNGDGSWPHG